jgi:hypothetical protein
VLRDRAQRAGGLLRDLGELSAEVSEVDVEAAGELKVVLRGAGEVLRMGGPPYRGKLQTYLELREDLERRCPDAEYFDLRFRDRIFVKQPAIAVAHEAVSHEAVPMSNSEPPSKAGPENAVVPEDPSLQNRSIPSPSPDPDPLTPAIPDAQGDASPQSPVETSEVGPV